MPVMAQGLGLIYPADSGGTPPAPPASPAIEDNSGNAITENDGTPITEN